jgi:THO complex subunit 2
MGVSTPKAPATTEVEDGEVDDAKNASTNNPKDNSSESSRNDTRLPPVQGGNDGKKSEILLRREKILRENAARSSTPTPPPSSIPPRPEIQRNLSANHTLPNRPDVAIPSRQLLDRHPPRQDDRRDVRDNRIPDLVRDRGRDRGREFPPGERRAMDAGPRDFRGGDRGPVAERDRSRPDSVPRWTGEPGRDNTDRASNGYRPVDNSGRLSRENAMAPPKSTTIPERGPPINPERLPLVNPERQEMINPERAALISGGNESSRSDSPRRVREETRDRSSRQNSPPRRHGSERDSQDQRRDERLNRNVSMDIHGSASRTRLDDNQPPPAGPRGERLPDRNNDRAPPPDRLRDASNFQPTQQPPRSVDLDHGRLSRQQQQADPNFGRLNQNSDIPSGPRERNTRNDRTANAPQARRDGRQPNGGSADIARPPTPDKQPPTGPSGGGRHPRRSASTSIATSNAPGQYDAPSAAPNNLPPTPVALSPTTAIHPDRLKHLGPQVTQPQPQSTAASAPTTAGMHPDRLRSFGGPATTNSAPQQDNTRARPTAPPLQTQNPPSGPKSQNSPASQRMNGPPTGPASATERSSRGRNPNVINNINRMLGENSNKPTQGQERNPRGRRHGQAQTPVSGPSTPILPPPPPPGPPPAQTRDAGRDLVNPERADLIGNNTPNSDDRNRGERDRSSRHDRSGRSRRSSPDRNRDQKRGPQEDERPERGDHRSRGSDRSSRDTERERHPRGEPSGGGRDLMGGSGGGSNREHRDRDSSRREGRGAERDAHESGGGSGNWANGSDNRSERRSQRSERSDRSDDRGMRDRKRRSDADGLREGGPEKRPRR